MELLPVTSTDYCSCFLLWKYLQGFQQLTFIRRLLQIFGAKTKFLWFLEVRLKSVFNAKTDSLFFFMLIYLVTVFKKSSGLSKKFDRSRLCSRVLSQWGQDGREAGQGQVDCLGEIIQPSIQHLNLKTLPLRTGEMRGEGSEMTGALAVGGKREVLLAGKCSSLFKFLLCEWMAHCLTLSVKKKKRYKEWFICLCDEIIQCTGIPFFSSSSSNYSVYRYSFCVCFLLLFLLLLLL